MASKSTKAMGDDPLAWLDGGGDPKNGPDVGAASAQAEEPTAQVRPMEAVASSLENQSNIVLDAGLGIADVAQLKQVLQVTHETEGDVCVTATAVEMLDTAALQLLVAFVREAKSGGSDVRWKDPSSAFCEAAALLDLERELGLPGADCAR